METRVVDSYSHYNSIISDGRRVRRMRRTQLSVQKIKNSSQSSRRAYFLKAEGGYESRQKQRSLPKVQTKRKTEQGYTHKKHLSNVHNQYYLKDGMQIRPSNENSRISNKSYSNNAKNDRIQNGLGLSRQSQRIGHQNSNEKIFGLTGSKQNYNESLSKARNNDEMPVRKNWKTERINDFRQDAIRLKSKQAANIQVPMQIKQSNVSNSFRSSKISDQIEQIRQSSNISQSKDRIKHHKHESSLGQLQKETSRKTPHNSNIDDYGLKANINGSIKNNNGHNNSNIQVNNSFNHSNSPKSLPRAGVSANVSANSTPIKSDGINMQKLSVKQSSSFKKSSVKQSSVKKSSVNQSSVRQSSRSSIKESQLNQPSLKQIPKQSSVKQSSPKQSSVKQSSPKQSSVKQSSPKQSSVKQSSPKQSSVKQSSPKQSSVKQSSMKQSSVKQSSPKQSSVKSSSYKGQSSPKQSSVRQYSQQSQSDASKLRENYEKQHVRQSSLKFEFAKEPSSFKEVQQIFSKNVSLVNGSDSQNFSKFKLDPNSNQIVTGSSARNENWKQTINTFTQIQTTRPIRSTPQQIEPVNQIQQQAQPEQSNPPSSNQKTQNNFMFESKKYSLRLDSVVLSVKQTDQNKRNQSSFRNTFKNLPLSSRGPSIRSSGNFQPGTLQAVIENIQIHLCFVDTIGEFKQETMKFDKDQEYMDLLCFLLDRKHFYQITRIVKALRGGRNIFRLTQYQIQNEHLLKHISNPQLIVLCTSIQAQGRQKFKQLQQSYINLKQSIKNNKYFQLQTPKDNFVQQIVRILQQQIMQIYEKMKTNVDVTLQQKYEKRIISIMETVFLFSELAGKKVKRIDFWDQIQMYYEEYCDQYEKALIQVFQYFRAFA